jgi:hypothetical protein
MSDMRGEGYSSHQETDAIGDETEQRAGRLIQKGFEAAFFGFTANATGLLVMTEVYTDRLTGAVRQTPMARPGTDEQSYPGSVVASELFLAASLNILDRSIGALASRTEDPRSVWTDVVLSTAYVPPMLESGEHNLDDVRDKAWLLTAYAERTWDNRGDIGDLLDSIPEDAEEILPIWYGTKAVPVEGKPLGISSQMDSPHVCVVCASAFKRGVETIVQELVPSYQST